MWISSNQAVPHAYGISHVTVTKANKTPISPAIRVFIHPGYRLDKQ
ncbi:hypothetical protein HMPREF3227_01908 [Corynebacterium sp. CMW7794]|nr:hypothetical protein HMPREF3227_01908 [Corynebacterium sp. CMW7794]